MRLFSAFIATLSLSYIVLSGCTPEYEIVLKRAQHDLKCSQKNMGLRHLGGSAYYVAGCGQRATYVVSCPGGFRTENCTAILNSYNNKAINSN